MIYKFNNGGIVKLQKAGSVPEYGNIEQIAKYNREHGTNFWKMSQVLEHDKHQAQRKTQDEKKSFWEILAGHPESAGEAILNKTIETANNAELPETRSKIYNDTSKAQLATTAGSLLTLPMLGEFSTYGLLGGASRLAGGFGGSAVGSYTLGKAGELGDRIFGTTWMKPTGQVIGGFAGWGPGSNIAYKGALDLASKVPSIARIGTTNRFIGDVAGRALGKSVDKTTFIPAQVKYYGPTMGKSYAAKTNPNLIDLDTWGRSEYDQLAKKYGYKDWREMILSDKGDYNEEYKQLIKDQIRRIQSDPQYSGKTIVVSNASLLKPSSGITFANTPVIPERSVMATRNNTRHPWESIEHGEEWWDSLQRKGTPLSIDNRFISEIEGNKVIPFTANPQKFVSTVYFDPRVKPLNKFGVRTDYEFDPRYKGLSTYDRDKLMFDDFLSGRKLASDFFNSEIKRSTDAFNKKLAESLGYNFVENKDAVARIEKPMIKTEDGYWIQRDEYGGFYLNPELAKKHSLGQYRPGHDDIILSGLGDIENISMHEHLHRGKFGEAPRTNIQKFGDREKWDSTDAFYQKLTDDIVDSSKPFDEYLSTPSEAATNLLETGRRAGIKIGQEYPGNEKAIEIFKEIIANDNQKGYILNYFKWKDEPEKVWKALTGRYYIMPLLGLSLYGTNK